MWLPKLRLLLATLLFLKADAEGASSSQTEVVDVRGAEELERGLVVAAAAAEPALEPGHYPDSAKYLSRFSNGTIESLDSGLVAEDELENEVRQEVEQLPTYFKGFMEDAINKSEHRSNLDPADFTRLMGQIRDAAKQLVIALRENTAVVVSDLIHVAQGLQQQIERKSKAAYHAIASGGAHLARDGEQIASAASTSRFGTLPPLPSAEPQGKELLIVDGGGCDGPLRGHSAGDDAGDGAVDDSAAFTATGDLEPGLEAAAVQGGSGSRSDVEGVRTIHLDNGSGNNAVVNGESVEVPRKDHSAGASRQRQRRMAEKRSKKPGSRAKKISSERKLE